MWQPEAASQLYSLQQLLVARIQNGLPSYNASTSVPYTSRLIQPQRVRPGATLSRLLQGMRRARGADGQSSF